MTQTTNGFASQERVLVLAPTPKDALRSRNVLADVGIGCTLCKDMETLCRELALGAGAVVLTEESLAHGGEQTLAATLRGQPPWSDVPILLLTGTGEAHQALGTHEALGNVTLLERPMRLATLLSATRSALRARRRQYQIRDHLAERERFAEALQEAAHRKDEFLAMLGHELRNPLAPIRNALQVLRVECAGNAVAEQMGGMMERQVTHMVRLVDDLLDVSRIARGKVELRKERITLAPIVARAVESQRPILQERQHRLEVSLSPQPLTVDADPARLEQVIANLLNNAAKYTPAGGNIALTTMRAADMAEVRIRDNGIGIRPEMLGLIFEIFHQADRVPGRVSEGLGLGLALVRRLVELHGGNVEARSTGLGQGSEFVVRLPLASQATLAGHTACLTTLAGGRRLRVLVVDDNEDGAKSLAMVLRLDSGHEVELAHDGPTALQMAPAFRPDVILLDIGLPKGMDGYDVARRLRQQPELKQTPIIALTGFGQEEDRMRSSAAGFSAHLVKPVDLSVLQELLAQL